MKLFEKIFIFHFRFHKSWFMQNLSFDALVNFTVSLYKLQLAGK